MRAIFRKLILAYLKLIFTTKNIILLLLANRTGNIVSFMLITLSHASAKAQGNVVRAICLSKVNPHF
jgi:hypothetical protein